MEKLVCGNLVSNEKKSPAPGAPSAVVVQQPGETTKDAPPAARSVRCSE